VKDGEIAKDIIQVEGSLKSKGENIKNLFVKGQDFGSISYYFASGWTTADDTCKDLFRIQLRNLALGPALKLPRSITFCAENIDSVGGDTFAGTLPSDYRVIAIYSTKFAKAIAVRTGVFLESTGKYTTEFTCLIDNSSTTSERDIQIYLENIFRSTRTIVLPFEIKVTSVKVVGLKTAFVYVYDVLSRYQPERATPNLLLDELKKGLKVPEEINKMYPIFRDHQNLFIHHESPYRDRSTIPTPEKLKSCFNQ
jgi:hypothetical protein